MKTSIHAYFTKNMLIAVQLVVTDYCIMC